MMLRRGAWSGMTQSDSPHLLILFLIHLSMPALVPINKHGVTGGGDEASGMVRAIAAPFCGGHVALSL